MNELRECPFCGGEAIVEEYGRKVFLAKCTVCGIKFPNIKQTKEEAIKAWNTRYEPPYDGSVPAGNERLHKEVKK